MNTNDHTPNGFSTRAVHAGEPRPRIGGAVSMPIFQSSTFETREGESYDDIRYIRLNNTPSHDVLHQKLAALEGAESALSMSSGMAAITTSLMALLQPGAHILAQRGLYGGTGSWLVHELPKLGYTCSFFDGQHPEQWEGLVRPNTALVLCETISNPLLEVVDFDQVVQFCRRHGFISIIDNTFASPVWFNPLSLGFDLVAHSATKYLNGHTDLVAGCVMGSSVLVSRIRKCLNLFGGTLDPHACYLLQRGIKTLELRVGAQSENALQLAQWLSLRPEVRRVFYPGLSQHASHPNARKYLRGYGGMLAFELSGTSDQAVTFCQNLQLGVYAPSLGGVETLVTIPARTSHVALTPEERRKIGISDGTIRVSVGIENISDLKDDFIRGLAGAMS